MNKQRIREKFRGLLANLSPSAKRALDRAVCQNLRAVLSAHVKKQGISQVLAFYPILNSEPDIRPLIRWLLIGNIQVFLPEVIGQDMRFIRILRLPKLYLPLKSRLEGEEFKKPPFCQAKPVILVPGLCFDLEFNRLGRGGGYYDRFLHSLGGQITKIGIAYSFCIVEALPKNSWDVGVDLMVTDKQVLLGSQEIKILLS